MKNIFYFVIISLLFVSCSSEPQQITTQAPTIIPTVIPTITQTSESTPTSTLIPFSELDLRPIVIVGGDLPAGFQPSQIETNLYKLAEGVPEPDNIFSQAISKGNQNGGGVDVLVYEDISELDLAYDLLTSKIPGSLIDIKIGEYGEMGKMSFRGIDTSTVVFVRCNAVVWIQIFTLDEEGVISYANQLDKRLEEFFCR
jgi:hypothetical protein